MRTVFVMSLVLCAACGGFSNEPLRSGVVEGEVADADHEAGLVTVVGRTELRAAITADGRFVLPRVPAGEAELFIVASRTAAARVKIVVRGAATTSVSLQPEPGAFVRYSLKTPAMQSGERVLLSVDGTPFVGLPFGSDGERRIGPLPGGCYAATIRGEAFGAHDVETCVEAGEERLQPVDFSTSNARCQDTGCEDDLLCAEDGRCVECLSDGQCPASLSCVLGRCEGQVAACAPCSADSHCGQNSCESSSASPSQDELRYCAVSCTDSCPQSGFVCQLGLCVPDPAVYENCAGYNRVGTPCVDDAYCRQLGLYGGECEQGSCTVKCVADEDCANGTRCVPSGSESYCLPP